MKNINIKIFIILFLLIANYIVVRYYFNNFQYESFNDNEMLSINNIIKYGQDDLIKNVVNDPNFNTTEPIKKLLGSGQNQSSSENKIIYIRGQLASYKLTPQINTFNKICKIEYLKILGKILNVYSENAEIINIFGSRIKENIDKIYNEKKNATLIYTYQDTIDVANAELIMNNAKRNMDNATANMRYYDNAYNKHSTKIYPTDKSYGSYINLMKTYGYTIDNVTQCFVDKKRTFCDNYVGSSDAKEKCLKATKYIPDKGEDKKFVEQCNSEFKFMYDAYVYYYSEVGRLTGIYNNSVNAYNTLIYNIENKNFIKITFESWEKIIKTNLEKVSSSTSSFNDELFPPDNNASFDIDTETGKTTGTPAPTKPPVSERELAEKTNIIFQNYIYCMRDICNKIIDNNLTANTVTDVIGDNNALRAPLYLNVNDINILSNGIETLVLSLRDSSGGLGGDNLPGMSGLS
jgi:hypothetical protein